MHTFRNHIILLIACCLVLTACRKDEFKSLNQIIPEKTLLAISEHIPLYEGNHPPDIEGAYVFSPCRILYSSFQSDLNDSLPDYHFILSGQIEKEPHNFVKFVGDNKIMRIDSCENSYLVGSGQNFTAYYSIKGQHYSGIKYKVALIFTGTKTAGGLIDCYLAIVLLDKNANASDKLLMPKGSFRIINDGDALVEKIDSSVVTKCFLKNFSLIQK